MENDFYCQQILSGAIPVEVVAETGSTLLCHHTRPYWTIHIITNTGRYQESKHLHWHIGCGEVRQK